MFKLDQIRAQQLGAEEEFGPPIPTTTQNVTQYMTNITGLQKNILYSIGAGVVAYVAYRIYNQ